MTRDLRRSLAALAVLPFLAVAACGGSSEEGDNGEGDGNANAACTSTYTTADASAKPPAPLPSVDGVVWYSKETQGESTYYFGSIDGDNVVDQRDAIKDAFAGANLEVEGTDQEENAEAELEFGGAQHGSVQVIHLCEGKLRIRYRVE